MKLSLKYDAKWLIVESISCNKDNLDNNCKGMNGFSRLKSLTIVTVWTIIENIAFICVNSVQKFFGLNMAKIGENVLLNYNRFLQTFLLYLLFSFAKFIFHKVFRGKLNRMSKRKRKCINLADVHQLVQKVLCA